MANLLTLARVALLFVVVATWARQTLLDAWWLDLAMVALLVWVIFMDALDGWVARRRGEASELGALLDIAGDRIVELVLWGFFAIRRDAAGQPLVPYWVPIVIITRTVATDLVRSVAFQHGKTPFGTRSMMESPWAKQLVSSRWSRAGYGFMKAAAFCALGLEIGAARAGATGTAVDALALIAALLVYGTALACVVRGIPVLWDGRHLFAPPPRS